MNSIVRSHASGWILSFVVGAATGAAIALLTAPRSGRETRRRLREFADDMATRASRVPSAVRAAGHEATAAAREAFVRGLEENPAGTLASRDSHH